MTRRTEDTCRAQPGTRPRQMFSRVVRFEALLLALALSACTQGRPLAETAPALADAPSAGVPAPDTKPYRSPPEPTDSRPSHCAADESVLISCRIAGTEDVASICVATERDKKAGHYTYGPLATPERVIAWPDSQGGSQPMYSQHRWFAGNTSGHSYSFPLKGAKHVFYSIYYMRREPGDQDVMLIPEGEPEPSRVSRCDPSSFFEVDHAARTLLTQGWAEDQKIAGDSLPAWDGGKD